ncbi:MAG TPA: invasion associated locus B family protein [Aliidongia sp.]|nr:invasion associated locus B family protein [Aliidongia sp.]
MLKLHRACGAVLAICGLVAAISARAEEPKLLGEYKGWSAYTLTEGKGGICYAVSDPKKSEPAKAKRNAPHLLVTHRPSEKQYNVVSIELGYTAAKDTSAMVEIDKTKLDFFTDHQMGWARDSETDKAAVTAMVKANDFTVKAKSASGTETTDQYALAGFAEALQQIDKACKVKR